MKSVVIFICIFLAVFQLEIFPQKPNYDSLVTEGINQIYAIKFTEAEKTFNTLKAQYPKHPAGIFFPAMIDWWRISLSQENEEMDDRFYEKIENAVEFCDAILEKDPNNVDALFFKGGAIGFRGRLRVMRESWLSAADAGREALPIVEYAAKLDPKNVDLKLGFGIYNYLAAVIPEKYPLVKPLLLFLPEGNKDLGLQQLKDAASTGKYSKYEAQYILMTFYYSFEKDMNTAQYYAIQLTKSFPNNPVFERWRGRIAARKSEWIFADSVFRSILNKANKNYHGYNLPRTRREANYYIGFNLKNQEKYDSALVYFKKCIDESKKIDEDDESGFRINATLYSGTIMETKGKYKEAEQFYRQVLDMREYNNSHTLAETYLDRVKKTGKQ
ncbi:MAG: hypothetical protein ACHQLA_05410 [Ignavibacteriales bacterium]